MSERKQAVGNASATSQAAEHSRPCRRSALSSLRPARLHRRRPRSDRAAKLHDRVCGVGAWHEHAARCSRQVENCKSFACKHKWHERDATARCAICASPSRETTLLDDRDAHGLGGADDGVTDGLQRDELAARVGLLHLCAISAHEEQCARRARARALAISYTCFSEIEPRGECPGFWLPDTMPGPQTSSATCARPVLWRPPQRACRFLDKIRGGRVFHNLHNDAGCWSEKWKEDS